MRPRAREAGIVHYLIKPVYPKLLKAVLRAVTCASHGPRRTEDEEAAGGRVFRARRRTLIRVAPHVQTLPDVRKHPEVAG